MNIMLNSLEAGFLVVDLAILLFSLLGNSLALYGIWKARFRLVGYRLFLISLVVGDLFLTWVHLLDKANQIFIAESMSQCCRCATFLIRSLLLVGVFVNLFNLCGMSVDHYIGIVYPLRYRYMMRKRSARWALLLIWFGAFCSGFADTPVLAITYYFDQGGSIFCSTSSKALVSNRFVPGTFPDFTNLTELADTAYSPADIMFFRLLQPPNGTRQMRMPVLTSEFGPSVDSYARLSYREVDLTPVKQRNQSQMKVKVKKPRKVISDIRNRSLAFYREQQADWCLYFGSRKKWLELVSGLCVLVSFAFIAGFYMKTSNTASSTLNSRSMRKLTLTNCLLIGVFAVCWLPFALVELVMGFSTLRQLSEAHSESLLIIHKVFYTIFLLNRILDPVVYVARLPNVQKQFGVIIPCLRGVLLRTGSEERSERGNSNINNSACFNADGGFTLHGSLTKAPSNNNQEGNGATTKDDTC